MQEYSPKRRTALVFVGSGTSGAYHAGVLKAFDEAGVKIDLLVGSGVGALAAAFGAVAGGAKLYGAGGFWDGLDRRALYRLRFAARVALGLLVSAFVVFLLPLAAALVAGLLVPLVLIADLFSPGLFARFLAPLTSAPSAVRDVYLAALAAPVFALSVVGVVAALRLLWRDRRRAAETLEFLLDTRPARERLSRALWQAGRGSAVQAPPPPEAELSKRFVALTKENLGQPGFREVILRVADLETAGGLCFVLLGDATRAAYGAARTRGPRSRFDGLPGAVDLFGKDHDALLFDAVFSGLLPPFVTPGVRVAFPRVGLFGGETHRLIDGTLAGGCGLADALAAGAEQVIVVSGVPEEPTPPPRRRGLWALLGGTLAGLERQAVERETRETERLNRVVETLGHRTDDGRRAWQDPESGRLFRPVAMYAIRPDRRPLGPLEFDGALDPSTEVEETLGELLERGYRDAYRSFIEPVVGAVPEAPPAADATADVHAVEL